MATGMSVSGKRDQPNGRGVKLFCLAMPWRRFCEWHIWGRGTMYYPMEPLTPRMEQKQEKWFWYVVFRWTWKTELPGPWKRSKEEPWSAKTGTLLMLKSKYFISRPSRTNNTNTSKPDPTKPDVNGLKIAVQSIAEVERAITITGRIPLGKLNSRMASIQERHLLLFQWRPLWREWANNTPNGEGVILLPDVYMAPFGWMVPWFRNYGCRKPSQSDPGSDGSQCRRKIWAVVVGVGKYSHAFTSFTGRWCFPLLLPI